MDRYLSVSLSQTLVEFTVEFDNEFQRCMRDSGYPGPRLSLVYGPTYCDSLFPGAVDDRKRGLPFIVDTWAKKTTRNKELIV